MKEENKKCWSCGRYQAYYTKNYTSLTKEDVGFCSLQNRIMKKSESCNQWRYRQMFRNRRKMMAINFISNIREKVDIIEQILTEEKELEKLKNE